MVTALAFAGISQAQGHVKLIDGTMLAGTGAIGAIYLVLYGTYTLLSSDIVAGPSINYGGSHGYFNGDPELDGIFIASGAGIKKGVHLDRVRNLDVAPTIARLLDLSIPKPDGRVLEEILAPAKL